LRTRDFFAEPGPDIVNKVYLFPARFTIFAPKLERSMPKGICFLCQCSMAVFVAGAFFACQSGATWAADADAARDSVALDSLPMAAPDTIPLADGRLAKRLKGPIVPPIDSLNPIGRDSLARYVKRERKRIRDSVHAELDNRPKHVYFTFDDGPLLGSAAVDSIATAKSIKISAFIVGLHADMSEGLQLDFEKYRDNPLVECYNHSYTHARGRYEAFYRNPEKACADFEKNQCGLGLEHKIARLPGRNIWRYGEVSHPSVGNGIRTADMLHADGYEIYGWDVEWKIDGPTGKPVQSVDEIYTSIRKCMASKRTREANNVVLLMHDSMFQSRKSQQLLSDLIDSIQTGTDYRFEFMRSYPYRY